MLLEILLLFTKILLSLLTIHLLLLQFIGYRWRIVCLAEDSFAHPEDSSANAGGIHLLLR
jgi:hypothetical protein